MEIERKFLVKTIPCLEGLKSAKIEQGYISYEPEIRIRKMNNEYYLTKKGEGTLVREEEETKISEDEGKGYFDKVISRLIQKTRYYIPYDKYTIELDIYENHLKGLVVAEVEFKTVEEAIDFPVPEWFSDDISEKTEYRNKILSKKDH